ncbi:MAG: alpha/beta hydrolase [Cryomorphaceae bacterium]|nr:alpha/beta hydrolase [Cryomorphaceae bacterium]
MELHVFLHGALGSRETVTQVFGQSEHALFVEFPGHGTRSDENVRFDLSDFARETLDMPEIRKASKISVFGYSMGGYVALLMAYFQPEKIKRIQTYGTKYFWSPEIANGEMSKLQPDIILEKVPAFANSLEVLHGANWKKVVLETARMMKRMGDLPPLNDAILNEITCPVEVQRGENDNMVLREEASAMAKALPHGRYVELKGLGHALKKVAIFGAS